MGGKAYVPPPPSMKGYKEYSAHLLTTKHALGLELPDKVMIYEITEEMIALSMMKVWRVHGCAHNKSFTVILRGDKFPYDEALNKLRVFA